MWTEAERALMWWDPKPTHSPPLKPVFIIQDYRIIAVFISWLWEVHCVLVLRKQVGVKWHHASNFLSNDTWKKVSCVCIYTEDMLKWIREATDLPRGSGFPVLLWDLLVTDLAAVIPSQACCWWASLHAWLGEAHGSYVLLPNFHQKEPESWLHLRDSHLCLATAPQPCAKYFEGHGDPKVMFLENKPHISTENQFPPVWSHKCFSVGRKGPPSTKHTWREKARKCRKSREAATVSGWRSWADWAGCGWVVKTALVCCDSQKTAKPQDWEEWAILGVPKIEGRRWFADSWVSPMAVRLWVLSWAVVPNPHDCQLQLTHLGTALGTWLDHLMWFSVAAERNEAVPQFRGGGAATHQAN
jgi:hypothetical protein